MDKKIKNLNKHKAFTLVEVLIYVSIFVVLIGIVTLFAASFIKSANKGRIKKEVAQGAYAAMNSIIYEIENADDVYTPTSVFNVHPGQLSLKTTQKTPDGERVTYIDFYLDGSNRIYLKRERQEPLPLTSENLIVTNLEFERLSSLSESVRISMDISYDIADPEYQYSYSLISSGAIRK